jgi:hypothetical protein
MQDIPVLLRTRMQRQDTEVLHYASRLSPER